MRILMVLNGPWRRDLGACRIQLELGEELTRRGHHVEKFSQEDAFPSRNPSGFIHETLAPFALRVQAYLRKNATRFNVIDAHQGCIVARKGGYNFQGRVIIRSAGLMLLHNKWERAYNERTTPETYRASVKRKQRGPIMFVNDRTVSRSFDVADAIITPNAFETHYLSKNPHWTSKVEEIPNAISIESYDALSAKDSGRADGNLVTAIGHWSIRKGNEDWPKLILQVVGKVPEAEFLFAGTNVRPDLVRRSLGKAATTQVRVVHHYSPEELPALISGAAVGAFTSRIEGHPISVIEQLAAGVPVVAYDIPGLRDILGSCPHDLLVPPGDHIAMGNRIVELLKSTAVQRARISEDCRAIARAHTWRALAPRVERVYWA